ncbi:hypothetical protein DW886_29935, partial [Enterocloster aldenensis]|uniref:hypothetical protein n=1 Tax=Enterocloster aldenensis TaxID=358742 RepID=UPI000FF1ED4B
MLRTIVKRRFYAIVVVISAVDVIVATAAPAHREYRGNLAHREYRESLGRKEYRESLGRREYRE